MKKRLLAVFMSVLMVVLLIPSFAFATENNDGTATLTIIHGVDSWSGPAVVVNVKYEFENGATLKDLFEAAKQAGDLGDYHFSYGYIDSITPAGGIAIANYSDYSYYWANYKNGLYASGYTDCTDADVLKDGDCFQFAYEGYPLNIAPDWTTITTSEKSTVVAGRTAEEPVEGSTTLKIVKGVDPYYGSNVLVCKEFDFIEGADLGDLLAAAKSDGAIDGYNFSYGYLDSITPADGAAVANKADYSSYWAVYKNGGYCSGVMDGTEEDSLIDGGSFEYAWEDYPTMTGLSETDWNALSADATIGSVVIEYEVPEENTEDASGKELSVDNEKLFKSLYEGLLKYAEGDNGWFALAAIAADKTDSVDKEAILTNALATYERPSYAEIQKSILLLAALGEDPSNLDGSGKDLIDLMSKDANVVPSWAEGPAYTLYAYGAMSDYSVSNLAPNAPGKLIKNLKAAQCEDGGFGFMGASSPDTTGAVLAGLSCFMNNDDAQEMIPKAVNSLRAMQNSDGGFGYAMGAATNADSTAQAIIGLCAVGIDPTGEDFTTPDGKNPITALLSFANAKGDDVAELPGTDMNVVRSDVLRALAAYSGLRNNKKAFNVYTMASTHQAKYIAPENKNVPQTGDPQDMMLWLVVISLLAGGMVTASAVLEKRK